MLVPSFSLLDHNSATLLSLTALVLVLVSSLLDHCYSAVSGGQTLLVLVLAHNNSAVSDGQTLVAS